MTENEAKVPEYVDTERPEASDSGAWHPETLSDVDWCLSRILELERQKEQLEKILADRKAELQVRHENLVARLERGIRYFSLQVEGYAEAHRAELLKGKAKSLALHHGSVGWRKVPAAAKAVDKDALADWAKEQPLESGFVKVVEEPAWSAIKAHVEATGEAIPGVEYVPEGEKFILKVGA